MPTLDDVRDAALALPDTIEKTHFYMPAFRVHDKLFVSVTKDHARVYIHVGEGDVQAAISEDSSVFGELRRGDLLLGLDADLKKIKKKQLNDLIRQAWKHRAPKKLAASLDG